MATGLLIETPKILKMINQYTNNTGTSVLHQSEAAIRWATLLLPAVRRAQIRTTTACRMRGKQRVV